MNNSYSRALRSRNTIFAIILTLMSVALIACSGSGTSGDSGDGDGQFALPTPTYPLRTVDFIVGAEQGSPAGEFAEAMASAFGVELPGDTSVVYQPGANGVTALEGYADIASDGHSLLVVTDAELAAVAAGETTVDATRAYLPSILGVFEPYFILGGADFADWEAVAGAARSGSLTVASVGPDNGLEATSLNKISADLGLTLQRSVIADPAARIGAPAAGTADLVIASLSTANAAITAGDLTPLLALWPDAVPGFDSVPTALEAGSSLNGLPGLRGIVLHRRTPQFLVDQIQQTLRRAKNSAAFQAWLAENGLAAIEFPSGDPGVTLRSQIPTYTELSSQ